MSRLQAELINNITKKCIVANRLRYYCFDDELFKELPDLVALAHSLDEQKLENGQELKAQGWTIMPIYQERNKLYRFRNERYDLVIKCFALPSKFKQVYYGWGQNSKAKRSFQNSIYLEEMEVGVAKARAFVEEYNAFACLKHSYYISDWVDYSKSNIHSEMRGYSSPIGFLPQLANFLVRLHELGIEHQDLSPGNILYKYDEEQKSYSFSLVDVNRMNSYPYALSPQISLKNLDRLASNYSVSSQLAGYYAEARHWDKAQTIERLNRICDHFWDNRLPKLTIRALKRDRGLSNLQIAKLYFRYKTIKLRKLLSHKKEQKAQLFAQEDQLYRDYFAIDDVRRTLRKSGEYSYRIGKSQLRP